MGKYVRINSYRDGIDTANGAEIAADLDALAASANNIEQEQLAESSVGSSQIQNDAVGSAELADDSIHEKAYQDASITLVKLAEGITESKLNQDLAGTNPLPLNNATEVDVISESITLGDPAGVVIVEFQCDVQPAKWTTPNDITFRLYRGAQVIHTEAIRVFGTVAGGGLIYVPTRPYIMLARDPDGVDAQVTTYKVTAITTIGGEEIYQRSMSLLELRR